VSGGARRPIALTLGEPAGIGPDITIAAWQARSKSRLPPFLFVGDASLLKRRAALLGVDVPVEHTSFDRAAIVFKHAIPCLAGAHAVSGEPGRIAAADTPSVIASIRDCVEAVHAGRASAVVTNPVQKKALDDSGFLFPGHTEFLGALAKELYEIEAEPVMMLASPDFRVVPVTIHIPLSEVPHALTTDLIVRTGRVVAHDLATRFGVDRPRLAFAGLNPHAGEAGMLGHEDDAVIRPAVEALRAEGIDAVGPLAADTMFHPAARRTYDVALCMYHDQALIPVKTVAFDEAVNVTLGLPFVRTSPDHGTALSLAGSGKARPTSLIAALKLAAALADKDAA
jgi:4-hydroxythreonine-4-phosphate dehydrogenase